MDTSCRADIEYLGTGPLPEPQGGAVPAQEFQKDAPPVEKGDCGMTEKKRILFVDDTPKVLDGLRRMIRIASREWEAEFAPGAQEALDMMARQGAFDIVVSDIRMPRISGSQLFRQMKMHYPQSVRVAMTDSSDHEGVIGVAWSAHQYLSKPCDMEDLTIVLARGMRISRLLKTARLRKMLSRIESLPSLPSLYLELVEEIASTNSSMVTVGRIIAQDMAMSAKVLQLANSAFYSRGHKMSDPSLAAGLLGMDTIKALAISTHVFSQFDASKLKEFSLEDLWNHSMMVASFARWVASAEKATRQALDDAFIAGLLHDVGRLALASELPHEFEAAVALSSEQEIDLSEAECRTLGAGHAETGAYLLGLWGLPDSVVEAVAFHHAPADSLIKTFSVLTAVHVANALTHELWAWEIGQKAATVDVNYLTMAGLLPRLDAWREKCQESVRVNMGSRA